MTSLPKMASLASFWQRFPAEPSVLSFRFSWITSEMSRSFSLAISEEGNAFVRGVTLQGEWVKLVFPMCTVSEATDVFASACGWATIGGGEGSREGQLGRTPLPSLKLL